MCVHASINVLCVFFTVMIVTVCMFPFLLHFVTPIATLMSLMSI